MPLQTTSYEPVENIADQREREEEKDSPEVSGTGMGNMIQT
jgi:hypothetical protein